MNTKKKLLSFCAAAIVVLAAGLTSSKAASNDASSPAQVTFTVFTFRPVALANATTQYTDATMALAPHSLVEITGKATDAALHIRGPVDLEIKIESFDPKESYTPLGIAFEQQATGKLAKTDPHGQSNFAPAYLNGSTLKVHDHFSLKGPEYHYEFFVLIQRKSDGAIGIIDPPIIHESSGG